MAKVLNEIKSSEKPGEEVIRQMTNQSYSLENIETSRIIAVFIYFSLYTRLLSNQ